MNVCERQRQVKVREEEYNVPCGSRYCAACGQRWMGDQRVQATAASEHLDGAVALVTITAPGTRWFDRDAYEHFDRRRDAIGRWNHSARRRWRELHLCAAGPLRRMIAQHVTTWRLLMRSWEYQKRGALHLHLVLPYGSPAERWVTELYLYNLWSCARAHGFGFVMGGDREETPGWDRAPTVKPADGPAAARYVAKYVASTGAGKEGMVAVAQRTAQRGSVLYISQTLTRRSGCTMTTLRARRRIYARHPRLRDTTAGWEAACLIDAVQRGRAPLTREAEETIARLSLDARVTGWADAADGAVRAPTAAPVPLAAREDRSPRAGAERVAVLVLASVLLRDSDRPELGPYRTTAVVVRVALV